MTQGRHILLVEDNLADAKLAMRILSASKWVKEVRHISDGSKALQFLHKVKDFSNAPTPDLVILDINLPGRSGREILKEIKEDEQLKQIPVVILTSSEAETDISECLHLHANAYMIKSLDLFQFTELLQSFEKFWFDAAKLPVRLR
jgi:CheY-like chemotaxis protein